MSDIAETFLIEFVKSILDLKAPKIHLENAGELKINKKQILTKSQIEENKIKEEKIEIPKFVPKINTSPPIKVPEQIIQKKSTAKPKINYSIQPQLSATEKLNILIKDPYVTEIECNGAENVLSVRKSGMIQNTQISLGIEEIYEIIAEFSQKTRIPVINGRIKAALNDLIITAVMSESLGPRFIIQKKKPFQELII